VNDDRAPTCAWPECDRPVDRERYGPRRGPKAPKYCMQHRLIRRHGPVDGQTIYERIRAARARASGMSLAGEA
jgi:hypothetical protein